MSSQGKAALQNLFLTIQLKEGKHKFLMRQVSAVGAAHPQEKPKPATDSISPSAYIIKWKNQRDVEMYVARTRKQISSLTTEARSLKQLSFCYQLSCSN